MTELQSLTMKTKKHIDLKKKVQVPYLRRWCAECKTMINAVCLKNGKTIAECECPEKISFRYVRFVPGEKRRIVRALGKDFNRALKQAATLNERIENGEFNSGTDLQTQNTANNTKQIATTAAVQNKPETFLHLSAKYIATLSGQGVAPHLRVVRSKNHINSVKDTIKHLVLAIRDAGFDPKDFRIEEISDDVVGKLHERLVAKGYSPSTYNRTFSHLVTFCSWAEREGYPSAKRFFEKVPRQTITPRPEVLTAEEFSKTLAAISYENGWQYNIGKRKEKRNLYRDYLSDAFRFALTGRRLEELIMARFSDIHCDEQGRPVLIAFTDYKVSRILHVAPGQERRVYSPVTKEIESFLYEQGFEQKKGTDEFIIATELTHNRVATMKLVLTRGFSHFYKVAHPDSTREISFKHIRKTVLTALAIRMGRDITTVSGHSGTGVLKHYLNEKQIALADSLNDFSVFGKEEALKKQRTQSQTKQPSRER